MRSPSLFLFLVFCIIYYQGCSQSYKGAVGARFGYGVGLSGLYMFNQRGGHGLEFLARYGYQGLILNKPGANLQVLYEKHWEIGRRDAWTVYAGAGPSIGFGKKFIESKDLFFVMGVSPIGGIDYTTGNLRIPLVLSFDYKPTLNTNFPLNHPGSRVSADFSYYEIAFSVRIGIR